MTERLAAFAIASREKYGRRVVNRAEFSGLRDIRTTSGSLALDHDLGGGIRIGGVHGFYGEKSGGKTTSSARVMGLMQDLCRNCFRKAENLVAVPPSPAVLKEDPDARWSAKGECDCVKVGACLHEFEDLPKEKNESPKKYRDRIADWKKKLERNSYEEFVCTWVDIEESYDNTWFSKLGVDNRRVLLIRPESAEEGLDIAHALIFTGDADFLCLDSIAQLAPRKELESSMEEWQQGLQARLVNKGIRRFMAGAAMVTNKTRPITQIWINQTRVKIGVMFGDPTVKPGGKGQEFAVHIEVKFKRSKQEIESEQYGAKTEFVSNPISERIAWVITKNKTRSMAKCEGSYIQALRDTDVYPAGTILEDEYIHKLALKYIVNHDQKAKIYKVDLGEGVPENMPTEFTSQKGILEAIHGADFRALARAKLLDVMLTGYR